MPKPSKQHIIDEIIKEVEKGRERGNILSTYVKKWQLSQRTFDRYWKTANQQHAASQQAIKEQLALVDTQAAVDARKSGLKSKLDRQMILQDAINDCLADLAKKRLSLWSKVTLRKCIKDLQAEISKMEGDYAPSKIANTDTEGNYVPPPPAMNDQQFGLILKTLNEATKPGKG